MTRTSEAAVLIPCEGEELVGVLHLPQGRAAELGVVVVVGGPQYRVGSHRQFVDTARALSKAGYAVLRFDYRGMGDSGAPMRDFERAGADIRSAIDDFLSRVPGLTGVVLYGLCDGASAALIHSAGDSRVKGLVLLNPWVRTEATEAATHLRHYYLQRLMQPAFWRKVLGARFNVFRAGAGLLRSVGRGMNLGRMDPSTVFVERMLAALTAFRGAVLFLISGQDLTAREFAELCRNDARWGRAVASAAWTELPGADHTFSTRAHLSAANLSCVEWLARRCEAASRDTTGENGVTETAPSRAAE